MSFLHVNVHCTSDYDREVTRTVLHAVGAAIDIDLSPIVVVVVFEVCRDDLVLTQRDFRNEYSYKIR